MEGRSTAAPAPGAELAAAALAGLEPVFVDARKIADFGIGSSIRTLLRGLASLGVERELVLALPPGVDAPGAARSRTARSRGYALRGQLELSRLAKAAGARLYHAPHYLLPYRLSMPAVVTIHDTIHLTHPQFLPHRAAALYARGLLTHAYRRSKVVLTVSHSAKQDLLSAFGGDPERIRVVPNGIDERFFLEPAVTDAEGLLARHRLPARYLLYVGNVKPHKNVERLIEAVGLLAARDPASDLRLVLAGAPAERTKELRERAARLRIAERVHCTGWLPELELRLLYRRARAFVFPSLVEGFGLPPLEAMAGGVPTLISRARALREVCGEAALAVDALDVGELAAGIERVWSEEELRARLAQAGPAQARRYPVLAQARDTLLAWRAAAEA